MSARTKPPFRADHVGSLLRPKEILEARDKAAKGQMSAAELRKVEDKNIKDAVALQEGVGLKAVTDGEYRRGMWHIDFLEQIGGVEMREGTSTMTFQGVAFKPPTPHITGKVHHKKSIMGPDFTYLKSVTKAVPKVCYPSPSLLHFRGGRGAISKDAYPDLAPFWTDLAKAYNDEMMSLAKLGCRYIQIDETDFAYLCDPKFREMAKKLGVSVDDFRNTLLEIANSSVLALDDLWTVADPDGGQVSLLDTIRDPHAVDPEEAIDTVELKDRLAEAIESLPDRERLVIALYYYETLTLREIGEVLGVTESRVSQLHTKAVLGMRSHLQHAG